MVLRIMAIVMAIVMAGATPVTITVGAIFATVLDGVIPLIEARYCMTRVEVRQEKLMKP
jgi:hypothetical protein